MSVERIFYCEGPGNERTEEDGRCAVHIKTMRAVPPPESGFIIVEVDREIRHFCGWDCLMKYAAAQPVPEVIE